MAAAQKNLLEMRILYVAYLITWFMLLFAVQFLKPAEHPISLTMVGAFVLATLADVAIAVFLRGRHLATALEALRTNSGDAAALKQWRLGNLLSFNFAECVTLFGVALRFLGAGWKIAGVFFAVGLLLLVAWTPRLDAASQ
jgi:hypothetical protein